MIQLVHMAAVPSIMIHIYQDIVKSPVWNERQVSARNLNASCSLEPQDINNQGPTCQTIAQIFVLWS